MGFLLKIIIFGTIGLVIMAKSLEHMPTSGTNQALTAPTPEAMIANVIKSTLSAAAPNPAQQPTVKKNIQRICKLKPNGDEECKNIEIN